MILNIFEYEYEYELKWKQKHVYKIFFASELDLNSV